MECIFCKIVKGEIKAYKLYEDDYAVAFLDINPVYKGHTLFIPKKHFSRIDEMDEEYYEKFMKSFFKFLKLFKEKMGENYNIVVNQGEKAGQVIFHLHIHLIPRDLEDGIEKLFKWETHKLDEKEANEIIKKWEVQEH